VSDITLVQRYEAYGSYASENGWFVSYDDYERLRTELAEARRDAGILLDYANHDKTCPQYITYAEPHKHPPCNCGLQAAIDAARGEP